MPEHEPGDGGHMENRQPPPTHHRPPDPAHPYFRLTPSTVVSDVGTGQSTNGPNIMYLSTKILYPYFYLRNYPDVADAYGSSNPLAAARHYWRSGMREGRSPSPFFDPVFYVNHHPDLQQAFGNDYVAATEHWAANGINEGRQGSRVFDIGFYLRNHSDLANVYGPLDYHGAFEHWKRFGHGEGRLTAPNVSLRLVDDNTAFGDHDRAVFYATAGASNNPPNAGNPGLCLIGLFLLVTADSPVNPASRQMAADLIEEVCRPTDREALRETDRNQYNLDQAQRNAATA